MVAKINLFTSKCSQLFQHCLHKKINIPVKTAVCPHQSLGVFCLNQTAYSTADI